MNWGNAGCTIPSSVFDCQSIRVHLLWEYRLKGDRLGIMCIYRCLKIAMAASVRI